MCEMDSVKDTYNEKKYVSANRIKHTFYITQSFNNVSSDFIRCGNISCDLNNHWI